MDDEERITLELIEVAEPLDIDDPDDRISLLLALAWDWGEA